MAAAKKDAGGEKEKKLTPEESAKLVLDYLRKTNRPYSATDISSNLKNRVTKATATKLLKDMHERKEIDGKVAGKAAVYHALQDEVEDDFFENITAMEEQTKNLREQSAALKSEEKDLRQALRDGASATSIPDIKHSIVLLEKEKAALETHLAKLRAGDAKPISQAEKAKILKNYKKMQKCVSARAKIRKELLGYITDAMGLSKERKMEMLEELGLEHMMG